MKLFLLISCAFPLLVIFCNSNNGKKVMPETIKITNSDQAERLRYKALGINYLKGSKNLYEVQIWIDPGSLKDSGQILILKKNKNLWHAELHGYVFIAIKESFEKKLVFHEKQKLNFRINSNAFSTKIEKIQFFPLTDSVYKKYDCFHGETICLELLKDKKYTKILFPCWSSIKNDAFFILIKQFLIDAESEFNIKIL